MSIQFCSMDYRLPTHLAELAVRKPVSVHSSWEPPSLLLLEQALSAAEACDLNRCEGALDNYFSFFLNDGVLLRTAGGKNRKRRFCLVSNRSNYLKDSCKQGRYLKAGKIHRSWTTGSCSASLM